MAKPVLCTILADKRKDRILYTENIDPAIEEWPHSWPDGEISYRLNSYSTDFSSRDQLRAVTIALRTWQLRINKLRFRRERSIDASVDFEVSFEPVSHFSSSK